MFFETVVVGPTCIVELGLIKSDPSELESHVIVKVLRSNTRSNAVSEVDLAFFLCRVIRSCRHLAP